MMKELDEDKDLQRGPGNSSLDEHNLIASRSVDIQDCRTVCLALGPYRNLTTLTAATLFLHPNCQVLNHAGARVFGNDDVDFLSAYSKERFDRFIQYAIQISAGGIRGDFGGSIIHSHAFEPHHDMQQKYIERGEKLIKRQINCLFWKESLATSNLIRDRKIDLGAIFAQEDRLKFLMPIRNPLDCAISNLNTGHVDRFQGLGNKPTITEVLRAILAEIHWFASLKEQFPDRFFYFFEHSISAEMIANLADFLKLDADETWLSDARSVMISKSNYQHGADLLEHYRNSVRQQFSRQPVLMGQLLEFVDASPSAAYRQSRPLSPVPSGGRSQQR
jgi:hypothetical protein